jgi:hypothetical protein
MFTFKKNIFILIFTILSIFTHSQVYSQTVITWDSVGQEVKLLKKEDYVFLYKIKKTPCHRVEVKEKGLYQIFKLLNECVEDANIVIKSPDTLFIDCDGSIQRAYLNESNNNKYVDNSKNLRVIKWKEFGQIEKINNCEKVEFIYSNPVTSDETDFVYEQVADGYFLTVKMKGEITELNFDCLCKRYEVTNPYSYLIKIDPKLRYEQFIMTPMDNDMWELSIGSSGLRNCISKARINLNSKITDDYENELPIDCNK